MIPFIRSFSELMILSQPNTKNDGDYRKRKNKTSKEDEIKRVNKVNLKSKKRITLPNLPKRNFPIYKDEVLKFIEDLDYNNQIQSSYELTLIGRQSNKDHREAA